MAIEAMDAAYEFVSAPRYGHDRPRADQKMGSVTVETFGQTYDAPETV